MRENLFHNFSTSKNLRWALSNYSHLPLSRRHSSKCLEMPRTSGWVTWGLRIGRGFPLANRLRTRLGSIVRSLIKNKSGAFLISEHFCETTAYIKNEYFLVFHSSETIDWDIILVNLATEASMPLNLESKFSSCTVCGAFWAENTASGDNNFALTFNYYHPYFSLDASCAQQIIIEIETPAWLHNKRWETNISPRTHQDSGRKATHALVIHKGGMSGYAKKQRGNV